MEDTRCGQVVREKVTQKSGTVSLWGDEMTLLEKRNARLYTASAAVKANRKLTLLTPGCGYKRLRFGGQRVSYLSAVTGRAYGV